MTVLITYSYEYTDFIVKQHVIFKKPFSDDLSFETWFTVEAVIRSCAPSNHKETDIISDHAWVGCSV